MHDVKQILKLRKTSNDFKMATGMRQGPMILATFPLKDHSGRSKERVFEDTSRSCFSIVRQKIPPLSLMMKFPLPLTMVGLDTVHAKDWFQEPGNGQSDTIIAGFPFDGTEGLSVWEAGKCGIRG
ncbi:unnamed protein product [Caretta caretta]